MVLVAVMLCVTLCGCVSTSTDGQSSIVQEAQYQEELMKQATDEIGIPEITEFFEKKMAKEIFEKRDDSKLVCYAYGINLDGKYIYMGRCYGYGLPYSTQYTNPEKMNTVDGGEYSALNPYTLPQADPNGLYSSGNTSATWLMMINETSGEPYIMYYEPTVTVTETKLPARLVVDWSLPSDY